LKYMTLQCASPPPINSDSSHCCRRLGVGPRRQSSNTQFGRSGTGRYSRTFACARSQAHDSTYSVRSNWL
jgi:hypothetical protein